jgi:hypothetical protein
MQNQTLSGPKIIWYIQFYAKDDTGHQEADLYIPTPPSEKNRWMNTRNFAEKNQKAIEHLRTIEKMCKELKKECIENTNALHEELKDPIKETPPEMGKKLKNLEILFNKFNAILKWLNKPPSEESH